MRRSNGILLTLSLLLVTALFWEGYPLIGLVLLLALIQGLCIGWEERGDWDSDSGKGETDATR